VTDIRTLRAHERGALLDLLDGWELADGWRGRDFFRRYLEDDPSYADENVFVAAEGGRLVSCAQVFPRSLCGPGGTALPCGGIGSVFTHASARGSGAARAVLEAAIAGMRARGLAVSLLFASPLHVSPESLYGRLGWTSWPSTRLVWRCAGAAAPAAAEAVDLAPFDPARDLDAVRALHASYSGARPGTVLRDTRAWQASLALGGNPGEEFGVARSGGDVVAYARGVVLYGILQAAELGRRDDAAGAQGLAALVARLLTPRADEPLASHGKASAELRRMLIAPDPRDAALAGALAARGITAQAVPDPHGMLSCVDADALARAAGVARMPDEKDDALLRRVLPPEELVFWPADRF
jgi:GNAT superfamily N-acetyltransferase